MVTCLSSRILQFEPNIDGLHKRLDATFTRVPLSRNVASPHTDALVIMLQQLN